MVAIIYFELGILDMIKVEYYGDGGNILGACDERNYAIFIDDSSRGRRHTTETVDVSANVMIRKRGEDPLIDLILIRETRNR